MTEQAISLEELMKQSGQDVTTAFMIYQTPEGQWAAVADFEELDLNLARKATFDDIIGGAASVTAGCTAQQAAVTTLVMMEQQAQQRYQMMQQQQEANKVASLIDPSKLRNPRA